MRDVEKIMAMEGFRIWGGFALFAIIAFWIFSSGDFSFLLTLSSLVSLLSFLMVALTIESTKTVQGVSLKMMECYIAVYFCRLCSVMPFEGYLPFDKSGDVLYRACELFGLLLAAGIVYLGRVRHAGTYDPAVDTFKSIWIVGPAVGIALVLHPRLNNNLPTDVSWAFALYLESVTVLPQFFMFMKERWAQPHTSHFLAAQALSRLMSFVFWASSFSELSNPDHLVKQWVGHWVIAVQFLQLIVMGDFIFHYVRALQRGIPVSEALSYSSMV